MRTFVCNGQRNRATARAQVNNLCVAVSREMMQYTFHQQFGFWSWNQHLGRDVQFQRPERLCAQYIGEWFAAFASNQQRGQSLQLRRQQGLIAMKTLRAYIQSRDLFEQPLRLAIRSIADVV